MRKLAEADTGALSGNPNEDWYQKVDGEGFFLAPLPRSAWRPAYLPGASPRPYTRRALLRFRIIPEFVGGLPVRFTDYRRTGSERTGLAFGASLFADFDVLLEDEADDCKGRTNSRPLWRSKTRPRAAGRLNEEGARSGPFLVRREREG